MSDFMEMVKGLSGLRDDSSKGMSLSVGEQEQALKSYKFPFKKENPFKAGDFVTQKEGIPMPYAYKRPEPGSPACVVEILHEDGWQNLGNYDGTPVKHVDMVVGIVDNDGDVIMYKVSSRYFEFYRGEV